jgi:hypothetical protein
MPEVQPNTKAARRKFPMARKRKRREKNPVNHLVATRTKATT